MIIRAAGEIHPNENDAQDRKIKDELDGISKHIHNETIIYTGVSS